MVRKINLMLGRIPVWAVWLAGSFPLALLIHDVFMSRLGVDPVVKIEHRLGLTGFYFLIGGLAVTPALRWFRLNLLKFRRALGLLAFSYLALHVLSWAVLDMGLIWSQMIGDLFKRPYLTFGMVSFVMLLPLAVTSNNLSIRTLGPLRWRQLHRVVYLAVVTAGLHYLWVGKVLKTGPAFWLGLIITLLLMRLWRPGRRN